MLSSSIRQVKREINVLGTGKIPVRNFSDIFVPFAIKKEQNGAEILPPPQILKQFKEIFFFSSSL